MFKKTFYIIIINLLLIINSYSNELKITSENLEVDRENLVSVFSGDVYAYNKDIKIWSDKLIVKFDNKENEIEQLNAENSVKIIREEIFNNTKKIMQLLQIIALSFHTVKLLTYSVDTFFSISALKVQHGSSTASGSAWGE